eukprot:3588716-Amphidinium_carterae.1
MGLFRREACLDDCDNLKASIGAQSRAPSSTRDERPDSASRGGFFRTWNPKTLAGGHVCR